jgi:hypothetical protein
MVAIHELYALLTSDGFAVISVTLDCHNNYIEFYPDMVNWHHTENGISWTDKVGEVHIDDNPEWHGGLGLTLAFRLWSEDHLRACFMDAGFTSLEFIQPKPQLGVPWSKLLYLPLIARKN